MNKLLVALIAGAFASVAAAQTAPPKPTTMERQDAVKSATGQSKDASKAVNPDNPTGQAGTADMQKANVKASREVAKMTRAEKEAFSKEIQRTLINPDNPSGQAGTAVMQKDTTAASKGTPKDRPSLKSPEAQKALEKASTGK